MNRSRSLFRSAAIVALSLGAPTLAAPLPSGGSIMLSGVTSVAEPWLVAGDPAAVWLYPFSVRDPFNAVVYSGVLEQRVYSSAALQRVIVDYRVRNTASTGPTIRELRFTGFRGFQTNAEFRTDLEPGAAPNRAARSEDGDLVRIIFPSPGVDGGVNTLRAFVMTNATEVAPSGSVQINFSSGDSATITGLRVPIYETTCPGDLNADGVINFTDLNAVLAAFGTTCTTTR